MLPISEKALRGAFVNASRKEVAGLTLPAWFDDADWGSLDLLGWRDPKAPRRAYAVLPTLEGAHVGVLLRQAEASPRARAQCTWCQDVRLPNDVVFFSARRAGAAGRKGDTIGTLVCESFQCSANARRPPTAPYDGYDVLAARDRRVDELRLRVAAFAETMLQGR
ncbi:FBP domain-containing protein [Agrococcus sp. SL85]|uniref:FBP domain-containing protein n=1 Tax=Agrococcus sp. SL85 TaxID=2995141 RepID=UPI00226CEADD|nr:FBP domain-containing protein [Agrococcus sp. SL85]WAC67258.1 FBP domain-containing protein [Agrococcus sp. SL85]